MDANKHKMLRYANAFKNQSKEDLDSLSLSLSTKLALNEGFAFKKDSSPSVSRSTSQSSFHRGWQILRYNTLNSLRGEVNHAMEEEVYNV